MMFTTGVSIFFYNDASLVIKKRQLESWINFSCNEIIHCKNKLVALTTLQ